jgi:hypothetical protein
MGYQTQVCCITIGGMEEVVVGSGAGGGFAVGRSFISFPKRCDVQQKKKRLEISCGVLVLGTSYYLRHISSKLCSFFAFA